MFGGIDAKKMQSMMSKMGIKQEELEAERVIIECADKTIVIEQPNVVKITMQGQESWQITGEAREEGKGVSDEDVAMVAEKTGVSEDKARAALEEADGDIAAAIVKLS